VHSTKIYKRSGGIAPHFKLGIRRRWVLSITLWLLYLQEGVPCICWVGGWVAPSPIGMFWRRDKSLAPARNWTQIPRLLPNLQPSYCWLCCLNSIINEVTATNKMCCMEIGFEDANWLCQLKIMWWWWDI